MFRFPLPIHDILNKFWIQVLIFLFILILIFDVIGFLPSVFLLCINGCRDVVSSSIGVEEINEGSSNLYMLLLIIFLYVFWFLIGFLCLQNPPLIRNQSEEPTLICVPVYLSIYIDV